MNAMLRGLSVGLIIGRFATNLFAMFANIKGCKTYLLPMFLHQNGLKSRNI